MRSGGKYKLTIKDVGNLIQAYLLMKRQFSVFVSSESFIIFNDFFLNMKR